MNKNLIFYFTGTGNSLQLAKEIGNNLKNTTLIAIGPNKTFNLSDTYNSIGFIYPTYFQGLPIKVTNFIQSLDFSNNTDTYVYGVTTYGALKGNAISQLKSILADKDIKLSYGEKLIMVSNYIVMYNPGYKFKSWAEKSQKDMHSIVNNIINRNYNTVSKPNPILNWYYNMRVKKVPSMDKDYNVSSKCTSCSICKKVCPANNIEIHNNKPVFLNQCEQCTACIQFCPNNAINYKNKTQKRTRYTNPNVNYKDLTLQSIYID